MSKIYKIINDINDKVYVGKTEHSIEKRFAEHCSDSQKREEEKRPLYSAMRKYGTNHFSIELIEECPLEESSLREQYWIGYYNGYTKGYNATLGGEGKAKIDREKIFALWQEGKALRDIALDTGHDENWLSQILQSLGVNKDDIVERGRKKHSKSVHMLDKNTNEILKTFSSTREAARYLIQSFELAAKNEGSYSQHISEVCRGLRKTCQGYKWQYANL